MRHLQIKFIGYRSINVPFYQDHQRSLVPLEQRSGEEAMLQIEIDKATWDAMFDLYEAHLNGFRNPTVQDAWDQYVMTLHLCGETDFAGHKKIV